MKLLSDCYDSPDSGKIAFHLALAEVAGELAAVKYDYRNSISEEGDLELASALAAAWTHSSVHNQDAIVAWRHVADLAYRDPTGRAAQLAKLALMESTEPTEGATELERLQWGQQILSIASDLPSDRWWVLMQVLCVVQHMAGEEHAAHLTLDRIAMSPYFQRAHVRAAYHLLRARLSSDSAAESWAECEEALSVLTEQPQPSVDLQAEARWGLAYLAHSSGDLPEADRQFSDAAAVFESAGDMSGLTHFTSDVAHVWFFWKEWDLASLWATRAHKLHSLTRNWIGEIDDCNLLASIAVKADDYDEVLRLALTAAGRKVMLRRLSWGHDERRGLSRRTSNLEWLGIQASGHLDQALDGIAILEARRGDSLSILMRSGLQELSGLRRINAAMEAIRRLETKSVSPRDGVFNAPDGLVSDASLRSDLRSKDDEIEIELQEAYRTLENELGFGAAQAMAPPMFDARRFVTALPEDVHVIQAELIYGSEAKDESRTGGTLVTTWMSGSTDRSELYIRRLTADELRDLQWVAQVSLDDRGRTKRLQSCDNWRDWLGELFFPDELREELKSQNDTDSGRGPLVIFSPASPLWGLPLSAATSGGRLMIEQAAIGLTPSLQLWMPRLTQAGEGSEEVSPVGQPQEEVFHTRALVLLRDVGGLEIERSALESSFECVEVDEKEFLSRLADDHDFDLGVISSHGSFRTGLEHELTFEAGGRLNAAAMLHIRLPKTVVLGACWSGALEFEDEGEPIGLPTMALLRGADAVVAGSNQLPDGMSIGQPTARLLAAFYLELAAGSSPAWALQAAQLSLSRAIDSEWWKWAGLACILGGSGSTRVPISRRDVVEFEWAKKDNINPDLGVEGRRTRGIVKWFSEKGFGFITQLGGGNGVFVHFSEINSSGVRSLDEGQQVEFSITQGKRGPIATDVRLVE